MTKFSKNQQEALDRFKPKKVTYIVPKVLSKSFTHISTEVGVYKTLVFNKTKK